MQLHWNLPVLSLRLDSASLEQLQRMVARALDPRPAFHEIANILRAEFRHNFAVGGDPPWRPLAPSTVATKRVLGLPETVRTPKGRIPKRLLQRGALDATNILIMTGDLRDSVIQKAHPMHVERISKQRVEVGTKHWLAPIHQFGTQPYVIMPKRARALRFYGADGRLRYAQRVFHPGVPPRPFLTIRDSAEQRIERLLTAYLSGEEWETL